MSGVLIFVSCSGEDIIQLCGSSAGGGGCYLDASGPLIGPRRAVESVLMNVTTSYQLRSGTFALC